MPALVTVNQQRSKAMMIPVRWNLRVTCGALLVCVQSTSCSVGISNGLYCHNAETEPNLAPGWGYQDGWEDGRTTAITAG